MSDFAPPSSVPASLTSTHRSPRRCAPPTEVRAHAWSAAATELHVRALSASTSALDSRAPPPYFPLAPCLPATRRSCRVRSRCHPPCARPPSDAPPSVPLLDELGLEGHRSLPPFPSVPPSVVRAASPAPLIELLLQDDASNL
ncbi:hypothetical protein PR202_gb22910 [Eleusine coracana subsp. coracana]|uniref:Uncharacterized protein n=1 Tax=Eleusine coracana subsp. coracana TaxID=191504 RepID=A0AAV5FH20_ELECO|nr:hypothetical protein PR202_gb22910 [Eleusine coracana subsp. coracana]